MVELSHAGPEISIIQEVQPDNNMPLKYGTISVPEGPDLSMIPDVCPSSLSMPSTAYSTDCEEDRGLSIKPTRSNSEIQEPNSEEDTQPKEGSQRESRSGSESKARDDARVGNGTIDTEQSIEQDIELEERPSIGTSHESGETWQPSFADYSWL